jgi:hypothetical protein
MKRPSDEQFATAVEWLEVNEGEEGEAEACRAVRLWILDQLEKRAEQEAVRKVAKETGRSIKDVRTALKRRKMRST